MNVEIRSEEDTVEALSYVEIIHLDDINPDSTCEALLARDVRPSARSRPCLTASACSPCRSPTEVGETVDDWHWNRYDHIALLTVESQASLMRLEPLAVVDEVWPLIERQQNLPEEERRRVSLACQWYWRADAEPDRVTRYIDRWVIVECLEMPETTKLRPVRRRLAALFDTDEEPWGDVGRLYQRRNALIHGNDWEVPDQQLQQVELLSRVLLTSRMLFAVSDNLRQEFLSAMGITLTALSTQVAQPCY